MAKIGKPNYKIYFFRLNYVKEGFAVQRSKQDSRVVSGSFLVLIGRRIPRRSFCLGGLAIRINSV
jgi:hypothetical protein